MNHGFSDLEILQLVDDVFETSWLTVNVFLISLNLRYRRQRCKVDIVLRSSTFLGHLQQTLMVGRHGCTYTCSVRMISGQLRKRTFILTNPAILLNFGILIDSFRSANITICMARREATVLRYIQVDFKLCTLRGVGRTVLKLAKCALFLFHVRAITIFWVKKACRVFTHCPGNGKQLMTSLNDELFFVFCHLL